MGMTHKKIGLAHLIHILKYKKIREMSSHSQLIYNLFAVCSNPAVAVSFWKLTLYRNV
jgi:hypothetical protein